MRHFVALALAVGTFAPAAVPADPLSVFQPTRVRPISITPADERALRALPPLDAFGTLRGTRSPGFDEVGSAREAARAAGRPLRLPAHVPVSVAGAVRYEVTQPTRTTFTFSAAKAAAWAKEEKVALVPFPPGLDGTSYTATLAPVAIVTYGTPPRRSHERGARRGAYLTVVQAPVPRVVARGASLETLVTWFTRQPGISPALAAQVRAIGDPTQTLPIPVRFDRNTATSIDVDGVEGLAIGDETGIGSAIVWTKGGTLYAVGGTFAQSSLLALAGGLR
ncbi:MAG TPA: hypothetical protein VMA36_01020 [Candidatus Limnocylindria bacterium]|nr:hypothetical protein [Candidatus Limnocylindria bacterium]